MTKKPIMIEVDDNGCFNCISHFINKKGYACIYRDGKHIGVHRYIYEKSFGSIKPGNVVRHKCDNPRCCNPTHLIEGTTQDNTRDMMERGRVAKGEKNARSKLTVAQVKEIKATKGTATEIAKKYNVSRVAIEQIRRKETWRHV